MRKWPDVALACSMIRIGTRNAFILGLDGFAPRLARMWRELFGAKVSIEDACRLDPRIVLRPGCQPLLVDLRGEELGEGGADGLLPGPLPREVHIGVHGKPHPRDHMPQVRDLLARETFFKELPSIEQHTKAIETEYARRENEALDAHVQEPLPPDHPLWDMPNVIVSPHNASASKGNEKRVAARRPVFLRSASDARSNRPARPTSRSAAAIAVRPSSP